MSWLKNESQDNLENLFEKKIWEISSIGNTEYSDLSLKEQSENDKINFDISLQNKVKKFNLSDKNFNVVSSRFVIKKLSNKEIKNQFFKYCSINDTSINTNTECALYWDSKSKLYINININKVKDIKIFINEETTLLDWQNFINKSNYYYFQNYNNSNEYVMINENNQIIDNNNYKLYKYKFYYLKKTMISISNSNEKITFKKSKRKNIDIFKSRADSKNFWDSHKSYIFNIQYSLKKKLKAGKLLLGNKIIKIQRKNPSIFSLIFKPKYITFSIKNIKEIKLNSKNSFIINLFQNGKNSEILIKNENIHEIIKIMR